MNLIRNEKIDLFFELFDSACMALYEDINIDYLEALIRVGNDLIFEVDDSRISEETYNKIFSIYNDLVNVSFTNEEIRLALELLIVKAFKHKNMPLDLMTPDTISYFISIIIEEKNKPEDIGKEKDELKEYKKKYKHLKENTRKRWEKIIFSILLSVALFFTQMTAIIGVSLLFSAITILYQSKNLKKNYSIRMIQQ